MFDEYLSVRVRIPDCF